MKQSNKLRKKLGVNYRNKKCGKYTDRWGMVQLIAHNCISYN